MGKFFSVLRTRRPDKRRQTVCLEMAFCLQVFKRMGVSTLLFAFIIGFHGSAYASKFCTTVLQEDEKVLNGDLINDLLKNPFSYIGESFIDQSSNPAWGTPFTIITRAGLKEALKIGVEDIEILSRNSSLRDRIFGNARSQKPLSTGLVENPLSLESRDNGYRDFPVEVGVDIFTLDNGKRLYIYSTSNMPNAIDHDYAYFSELISNIKEQGHRVVALDSAHTHPINLIPTIMDEDYFRKELRLIKKAHPEIDFKDWRMYTTMDGEPVLHQVNMKDWMR